MGHPEHDLLFVATQVAKAAGLRDPTTSVSYFRALKVHAERPGFTMSAPIGNLLVGIPRDSLGRTLRSSLVLFKEADVYQIHRRGNAPQSESFRRWVIEEVLPIIRKTSKYDAEQSRDPRVLRT